MIFSKLQTGGSANFKEEETLYFSDNIKDPTRFSGIHPAANVGLM